MPKIVKENQGDVLTIKAGGTLNLESGAIVTHGLPVGIFYYVDSVGGSDSDNGLTWATALATIAAAEALSVAGDTIFIKGSFNEAVVLTGKAGVTLEGIGTTTNQALWTAPNDGVCLTISASADCVVRNIRFRPPAYVAGIPAAISLVGASNQTTIEKCRFQGKANSWYGILSDGYQSNVHIVDNEFYYINTATYGTAIKGTHGATADATGWVIEGNKFHSNLNHIVVPMLQGMVVRNILPAGGLEAAGTFSATMTVLGIDVHGAAAGNGYNVVTQNHLGSLYHQACYYGGTGDEWSGNYCVDRSHATQVDATTGLSKVAPAA